MKYDLVVVGSGISGVSCAFFSKYFCKEKNILLIEKLNEEKYEKYHQMCGCVVSKKLFKEINPIAIPIIGKIKKQIEVFPNKIELEEKVDGVVIDRISFLKNVKEKFIKLGGEFLNCSLVDFLQKDEIKIKLNNNKFIKTKYLIDCSGANSLIRKKLGIKANKIVAFQYLIEKVPLKETIIFEYDEKYKGNYKWTFPYRNFTKIGLPFNFKIKEKVLEKQVRTISFGGLKKYVYGNILLCGESGCQTNALTKGGIRIAMVSGKLSALAVLRDKPSFYEEEFKKTNFANEIFLKTFNIFKKMKNKELAKIGEIFISKSKKRIKEIHDNFALSKAFILSQRLGW